MAQQGKSSEEIWAQRQRILSNPNISDDRAQKVIDTAMMYNWRIANTKQYKRDVDAGKGFDGARSRKYSRATYMGIANNAG